MYKILMVDDHAMVRTGLKSILEDELPGVEVKEAGSAQEGLAMLKGYDADLVVLDLGLPDRSGLDVLKRVHHEWPSLPVLVLSMYSEDQYGLRVMRAGAAGYLTKASAPENLLVAVRKVRHGGRYVSATLEEKLAAHIAGDVEEESYQALSDREYQVFRLIASGKTVTEISTELCLSVKTISTHRTHILEKTGLKNNAEITHYAMQRHLVD
jgi:two-component system invasion response regulator UvrY